MNYPRMLFPAGDVSQQYRIVADEDEESEAVKAGYAVAYSVKAKEKDEPNTTFAGLPDTAPVTPVTKPRGRPAKAK